MDNENTASEAASTRLDPDRVRFYQLRLNAHKLKNRSSKSILSISNPRWDRYNIYRHVSRTQLETWSKEGNFEASYELNRRFRRAAARLKNKTK